MKRILIINVNWLGDVLFSTPFIRAIRKRFPQSYIACMVVPRCRSMLELNPNLNEIIIYDEEGRHKGILGKTKLIMFLRSKRFDAAFILHRSFTRALIVFLSGIKKRIGYRTKRRTLLLTDPVELPRIGTHKVDYFLNIAGRFGADTDTKDYEFFVSDLDRKYTENLLSKEGIGKKDKLVVINPGGNWDLKRWPKENFAKLSDSLIKKLEVKVAISGAEKDRGLGKEIASIMKEKAAVLCGRTSLKELGALLERADLVISNDSGPMHIAVSMKTPVVSLFGPTSSEFTGPYGRGNYTVLCRSVGCKVPCYQLDCTDNRCMKAITPEEVFAEAKEMLDESR